MPIFGATFLPPLIAQVFAYQHHPNPVGPLVAGDHILAEMCIRDRAGAG